MSNQSQLRPTLQSFANLMEQKLRENDHKRGWQNDPLPQLFARLVEEAKELDDALECHRFDATRVARESADVANFAMMIADNATRMGGQLAVVDMDELWDEVEELELADRERYMLTARIEELRYDLRCAHASSDELESRLNAATSALDDLGMHIEAEELRRG